MSAQVIHPQRIPRFHSEVQHIHGSDYHAEEFPTRPLKPVKGRRPTMYVTATQISSEEDLTSEASDASDYAKLRSIVEGSIVEARPIKEKKDKSVALKVAERIRSGTKSRQQSSPRKVGLVTKRAAREVVVPMFADGLSLMQLKGRSNDKSSSEIRSNLMPDRKKHAFARLVDAARHLKSANGRSKVQEEPMSTPVQAFDLIAPWIKAHLLDLAKAAKVRADLRTFKAEMNDEIRQRRDNVPSWSVADVDQSALLLNEESPMSSLIPEFDSAKSMPTARRVSSTAIKLDPIGENRLRFVDSNDEVIWIGRDGQVVEEVDAKKCNHHHHRKINEDCHPDIKFHHLKVNTDEKVKQEAQSQHRHHHHHSECACSPSHSHCQSGRRHRHQASDYKKTQSRRPVVTFEGHVRLEHAYGEAMEREVKSHLVHDAISLGGSTW